MTQKGIDSSRPVTEARMKRSEIREWHSSLEIVPGLRFASSGLQGFRPDRDEAGYHDRPYLTKIGI
jgi:hypothetical protein